MPAQLIFAQVEGPEFIVRVWLDTGKTIGSPDAKQPDPDWLYEQRFPADVDPQEATRDALLQAKEALKERQPPKRPQAMPSRLIEGLTFDLESLEEEAKPMAPTEAEAQQPEPHVAHRPPSSPGNDLPDQQPGTKATREDKTLSGMPKKGG